MNLQFRLFLILIIVHLGLFAGDKKFIREYTYNASDSDSKISSREKAIEQVKILLLEEIGIYINSYVHLEDSEKNNYVGEFIKHEIETVTAGITETKILNELWDGQTYKITAEIQVDPEDVIKRINDSIESRNKSKEIDRLNQLLTKSSIEMIEKQSEIKDLKAKLDGQNSALRNTQIDIENLRNQLNKVNTQLSELTKEKLIIQSEYDKVMSMIKNTTYNAMKYVELGMTPEEVIKLVGQPRSKDSCSRDLFYNYGEVWILFQSNVVSSVFYNEKYQGSCYPISYYISNNIKR